MGRQRELFASAPVRSSYSRRQRRRSSAPPPRRLFVSLLIGACVVIGIGAGLYFGTAENRPTEIPTVRAELPIKERPAQPGGIEIPHQDVTVFDKLEPQNAPEKQQVEHLLPPPEVPQHIASTISAPESETERATATAGGETVLPAAVADISAAETGSPFLSEQESSQDKTSQTSQVPQVSRDETAPAPVAAAMKPVETTKPLAAPVKARNVPVETMPAPSKLPSKEAVARSKKASERARIEKRHKAKIEQAAKTAQEKTVSQHTTGRSESLPIELFTKGVVPEKYKKGRAEGSEKASPTGEKRRIQFASLTDKKTGENELSRLQRRYSADLKGARLYLIQGKAGGKTVFRVMTEKLDAAQAEKICKILKSKGASCLTLRP